MVTDTVLAEIQASKTNCPLYTSLSSLSLMLTKGKNSPMKDRGS